MNSFLLGSKILVICAHPDDEVLGCGGLLAANKSAGGISHVLVVSEGTVAQYGKNAKESSERHASLTSATEYLGVERLFHWDFPDMALEEVPHTHLNNKMQNLIYKENYDYVFTHDPSDINRDHKVVFESTMVACRPIVGCKVKGIFTYFVNSSSDWGGRPRGDNFFPNAYLNIEDFLEHKLTALAFYNREIKNWPHPRSLEAVRYRAFIYGSEIGYEAAEPFGVVYLR